MFCPECGKKNNKDAVYCKFCGEQLNNSITEKTIPKKPNNKNSDTSLILGIISLVGIFFLGIVSIICGIIGMVIGCKAKKETKKTCVGFILSLVGLIIGVLEIIAITLIAILIFVGINKYSDVNGSWSCKSSYSIFNDVTMDFDYDNYTLENDMITQKGTFKIVSTKINNNTKKYVLKLKNNGLNDTYQVTINGDRAVFVNKDNYNMYRCTKK